MAVNSIISFRLTKFTLNKSVQQFRKFDIEISYSLQSFLFKVDNLKIWCFVLNTTETGLYSVFGFFLVFRQSFTNVLKSKYLTQDSAVVDKKKNWKNKQFWNKQTMNTWRINNINNNNNKFNIKNNFHKNMQRHVESTARNRKISLQKNEGFIFGVNSTVSILPF